jgi:hypothetical protein
MDRPLTATVGNISEADREMTEKAIGHLYESILWAGISFHCEFIK